MAHLNALMISLLIAGAMMGVVMGTTVGYHAVDEENATVAYDPETQDLTVGSHTSNLYECPDEELNADTTGLREPTDEPIIGLSDRVEEWVEPAGLEDNSCEDDGVSDAIPEPLDEHVEAGSMVVTNVTMASAMTYTALVADVTASVVFGYQNVASWRVVKAAMFAVLAAPIVVAGYALYRKVSG